MNDQLVGIYGARGHGRDVLLMLAKDQKRLNGSKMVFIDDDPALTQSCGLPCLSLQAFADQQAAFKSIAVAVGHSKLREIIHKRVEELSLPVATIVADSALVFDSSAIEKGTLISPGVAISSGVRIGEGVIVNSHAAIAHDCKIGDFVTIGPGAKVNGCVEIGEHAMIGSGALIRQGTIDHPRRIGRGAIIGMGAVVLDDIPDNETWVGNPARLRSRK